MRGMPIRLLQVIAAGLAALVLGLALFWHPEPPPRAIPRPVEPPGGDFTLRSGDGPVAWADLRGKVVLVYFGYTYCPDVCPTALTGLAEGLKTLGPEEAAGVATLFVSVDPDRDTPAHLKEYVAFFHPGIVGLTGSPAEVAEVARRYGVYYARQKAATAGGAYVVDHTSETYVLGRDGRLAGRIPHGASPERVAAEIRKFL